MRFAMNYFNISSWWCPKNTDLPVLIFSSAGLSLGTAGRHQRGADFVTAGPEHFSADEERGQTG